MKGQWSRVAIATLVLLAFSFVLGGASRQHEVRLALIELAALPTLVLALLALTRRTLWPRHRLACAILAAVAAVPLLQIIPLPPQVWSQLPGRQELVATLAIADLPPGWSTWSLTPDRTWRSFLALLPPAAVFLGVLTASGEERLKLIKLMWIGTTVAIALGALQFASDSDAFYLWPTTDAGNVVGFFANRNHMATLCLTILPFAAVLGAAVLRRGGRRDGMMLWLGLLFIALVILTLGAARSRAGVILLGPALGASLIAGWIASGRGWPKPLFLAGAGVAVVGLMALAVFALGPVMERFDTVGAKEGRFENWPTVLEAADTYLPVGSGIGSFDTVFRSVEPLALLDATFFNQAHNEYLETWLETGWIGVFVLIAFFIWYGRRSWTAWRAGLSTDRDIQRAASVAILIVLLHSTVDYPLRTEAMATLFAFFCAVLELTCLSNETLASESGGGGKRRRRINR